MGKNVIWLTLIQLITNLFNFLEDMDLITFKIHTQNHLIDNFKLE